ncbi:MAG: toxin-antitoxin system YwqK family antitoxin [Winogradskyella sp.]|jgi:antitoxin component YwqK of YwqJK toxin-antitoxin module|nr:toxin-antitoxin system YwqK family antitoxin [Winogradskyella sp.]
MKNMFYILLISVFFSCSKYGDDGDGKGNLKYQFLKEECHSSTDVMSFFFLRPEKTTKCYMTYNGEKFTGSAVEYHDNGKLKLYAVYDEGHENTDLRKEYFDNGQLIYENIWSDDTREMKEYYKNGNLAYHKKENFMNPSNNFEISYHENGKEKSVAKDGKYLEYFYNGSLKQERIELIDNFKHVQYFKNNQLKHKEIINDTVHIRESYAEDGSLVEILDMDSKHVKYDSITGLLLLKGRYQNGSKVGEWISYYDNGKLKKIGSYSDGVKTGNHIYYHKNGVLNKRVNYQEGILIGEVKEYYNNGKLKVKMRYSDGFLFGKYLEYHDNGKLKTEGYYQRGSEIGLFKYYNEKGELESAETFGDEK